MECLKHTLTCRCILPQYKKRNPSIFHKFITFSRLDENDQVISSYSQCNNCGIIHKIIEIGKSEIINGKESLNSIPTIRDIKLSLPVSVAEILESYNCELYNWQHAQFILDYKKWGTSIVLTRDEIEDKKEGKILVFIKSDRFRIDPYRE